MEAANEFAREVITAILTTNDKALVANLLDQSKKVIIDASSLKKLISLIADTKDIEIEADAESKSCSCKCGTAKFQLFETIASITVDGEPIDADIEKYINETLNISTQRTYASSLIKIEREAKISEPK